MFSDSVIGFGIGSVDQTQPILCLYCLAPIDNRSTGDHIFPQGFGKFLPNFTIKNVCKQCDEAHGGSFELIAFRTGMLGFFRKIYSIQSGSSKKKSRKPTNPTLDIIGRKAPNSLEIKSQIDEKEKLYLTDEGVVTTTNVILVYKHRRMIDKIYIPATRNIRDICNFIDSKIQKSDYLLFSIEIHENAPVILRELERRGHKFNKLSELVRTDEIIPVTVSAKITDIHLKLILNIAIKAMTHLGYERSLISPMIEYVHSGKTPHIFKIKYIRDATKDESISNPSLDEYSHEITWEIRENTILIRASLMKHFEINGLDLEIRISSGQSTKLIVPFGGLTAKYSKDSDYGNLNIFLGKEFSA